MRGAHVTACHGLAAVHLLHVHFVKQRHAIQRGTTGKNQKNSHCRAKLEPAIQDVSRVLLAVKSFQSLLLYLTLADASQSGLPWREVPGGGRCGGSEAFAGEHY
ncbi:MAG: hypothetical protein JWM83_224, partial [Candidatus Angelobacter sp.]|nr:hypothetical protein [Candidatus Angelobacter sp.]